jgi:hypothetical protein
MTPLATWTSSFGETLTVIELSDTRIRIKGPAPDGELRERCFRLSRMSGADPLEPITVGAGVSELLA